MASSTDMIRDARDGLGSHLDPVPRRRTAIVTCMDTRLAPLRMLRASAGDLHIIRNAGGIVTGDVVRSLTMSVGEFGTREILLIMHTDCGMDGFDEERFRHRITESGGTPPPWPMLGFEDVEAELARGVARLRSEPTLRAVERIEGRIYDVRTGRLGAAAT